MNKAETLALGVAIGAGLAYFLDPDRGTRRRAGMRDQLVHAGHELEDAAVSTARHARNRTSGLLHEARAGLRQDHVDDRVLEERVRSEIGRSISGGSDVEVTAAQGRITLSGTARTDDVQGVVRAAKSVRGVAGVENRIEPAAQADNGSRQEAERA